MQTVSFGLARAVLLLTVGRWDLLVGVGELTELLSNSRPKIVRITYFDEVKANPQNGQEWYFVGGLSVPADEIPTLEEKANLIAEEVFETRDLTQQTEFHAAHIYFGKGAFKRVEPKVRIDTLVRLARAISESEGTKRVYAAINTAKLYSATKAPEFAFAHFCERVQMSLGGSKTLLIGDQDDEHAKSMIAAFAQYRNRGTPWDYGIKIEGIIDAVHFARSHHSRMIQLADVYLFLITHSGRKGWFAEALAKELREIDLGPHRYKRWPN